MLCKRTMRAALAPLVGLIGLLGATMVSAQDPNTVEVVIASQVGGVDDVTGAVTIASESLVGGDANITEGHYHVNTASGTPPTAGSCGNTINNPECNENKPESWLELRTEVDILLSNRGTADHYYVRYDFTGMVFSEEGGPPKPEIVVPYSVDVGGTATTTKGYMVDQNEIEVAYRGRRGDSTVIFRLPNDPSDGTITEACYVDGVDGNGDPNETCVPVVPEDADDYLVGTKITLLLPHHLAVMAAPEATYGVTAKVFEDLSEARENNFGADVYSASGDVIKLAPAVSPATVEPMLATAEVSTPEDEGGAFRLFVDADDADDSPDMSANLAMVKVGIVEKPGVDAAGGLKPVTDEIITGVSVKATSDVSGAFGFGSKESFKISAAGCGAGSLTLMKTGDDGPEALAKDDELDVATSASGDGMKGTSYFCVMVGPHTPDSDKPVLRQAIPEIGNPEMKNGYMLAVTPMIAEMAPDAVKPLSGEAMAAGSIDRNGTTVHLSYLSGSDNANQRLVIVNRGRDTARFWMSDFQAEGSQMVTHSGGMMLAQASQSEIAGGSRVVIRIQDNLSFSERPPRTAGTLTVAGPTRNIDVMTIQVVGGTLDTTVYQHAE